MEQSQLQRPGGAMEQSESHHAAGQRSITPDGGFSDSDTVVEAVHIAFGRHAMLTPDATAFEDAHRNIRVSYGDLNDRANRVASALLDRVGVGVGRIGIVLEDDFDTLVAVLGAWKAGKTPVPLDTANPPSRLNALQSHAEVEAVVGAGTAMTNAAWARIDISSLPPAITRPEIPVDLDAPARIMYTSGSTGAPKGVVHSHRYLATKVATDLANYAYTAEDRLSQTLPVSFAASTTHSLGALANGATLCLYKPAVSGLQGLAEWISSQEVTGLQLAPGLFRRFADQLPSAVRFPSVRYLLVGGDRVLRHDIELFQRHFGKEALFIHRFAATECGPIAEFVTRRDDPLPGGAVPLGLPLRGRRLAIVGDDGSEVEAGQVGEIILYANDLADGYWRDAELSKAVFGVAEDGTRLYRTGDLGRVNVAGQLEAAGRADKRVKIHGYGVDLVEVEMALLEHSSVREVVAAVRPAASGEDTLIAYIVTPSGTVFDDGDIRGHLAALLPRYSIPTGFVLLDAMPLTSRGKLDRGALPPWTPSAPVTEAAPAHTETERELVKLYEETLGVSGLGIHDDFWELGGTSMEALLLFAAISEQFDRNLAPTALIEAPDVESLARLIESGGASVVNRIIVPIRSDGGGVPLICVHGGGGGIFFVRDIGRHMRPDQSIFALQAEGFEGMPPPYRSVEDMARRYTREITDFGLEGPYLLCGLSFGGLVAIEIARNLQAAGHEIGFLGLLDTKYPRTRKDLDEGIERHTNRMSEMTTRAKAEYVVGGAWKRIARRPYRRWRTKRFVRDGRPIPAKGGLRNSYFFSLHARASREYQPAKIDIPLELLSERSMAEEQRRLWQPIASAGLNITEVDGDHHSLIREPIVREVASWLQANADSAAPAA